MKIEKYKIKNQLNIGLFSWLLLNDILATAATHKKLGNYMRQWTCYFSIVTTLLLKKLGMRDLGIKWRAHALSYIPSHIVDV